MVALFAIDVVSVLMRLAVSVKIAKVFDALNLRSRVFGKY
jgi:hypothetical protein